jgi:hypothetical protein
MGAERGVAGSITGADAQSSSFVRSAVPSFSNRDGKGKRKTIDLAPFSSP